MLLDCFRRQGFSFRKVELWDNLFAYSSLRLYLLGLGNLSKRSLISFIWHLLWCLTSSSILQLGVLVSLKASLCAKFWAFDRLRCSSNLRLLLMIECCEASKTFPFSSLCSSRDPRTLRLQKIRGWACLLLCVNHRLESCTLRFSESLIKGLSLLCRCCILESRCFLLFVEPIFKARARSLGELLQLLAWAQVEEAPTCLWRQCLSEVFLSTRTPWWGMAMGPSFGGVRRGNRGDKDWRRWRC